MNGGLLSRVVQVINEHDKSFPMAKRYNRFHVIAH